MTDQEWLTPEEARARFGELLHGSTRTHQQFTDPGGGLWRPELVKIGAGFELRGYRLHPPVQVPEKARPPYRPKPKA